jgi:hypothetical protein
VLGREVGGDAYGGWVLGGKELFNFTKLLRSFLVTMCISSIALMSYAHGKKLGSEFCAVVKNSVSEIIEEYRGRL